MYALLERSGRVVCAVPSASSRQTRAIPRNALRARRASQKSALPVASCSAPIPGNPESGEETLSCGAALASIRQTRTPLHFTQASLHSRSHMPLIKVDT